MAGRVNLNVPPRLIESARAAQYANREVQSAAEQARRLRGRVQQRQEAAKRAQPQAQTADGRGGVFDAPAIKRAPRIWRKRRPLTGYKYGAAYLVNYPQADYRQHVFRVYAPNGTAYASVNSSHENLVPTPSGNHLDFYLEPGAFNYDNNTMFYQFSVTGWLPGSLVPSSVYQAQATNWTILPAGNGNVVFVFSHYTAWTDFYFTPIVVNNQSAEDATLSVNSSDLALTQKAFFVSSGAVKEIALGAGFRAFTEGTLLPIVWHEWDTYNKGPLPSTGAIKFSGRLRLPEASLLGRTLAVAPCPGGKPFAGGYGGKTFEPYDRARDYYTTVRFGDLDSGGIAPLYGFGPGIYSYLANPTAANAAVDAAGIGPWAKQAAAEQFIGDNLLPNGSLADSSINPKRSLLYTGAFPPVGRTYGTMSQFNDVFPSTPPLTYNRAPDLLRYNLIPNSGAEDSLWETQDEEAEDSVLYRTPFSGGFARPDLRSPPGFDSGTYTTPILFWDWDNPDYCRRQLLSLGFSEADLTP